MLRRSSRVFPVSGSTISMTGARLSRWVVAFDPRSLMSLFLIGSRPRVLISPVVAVVDGENPANRGRCEPAQDPARPLPEPALVEVQPVDVDVELEALLGRE